MARLWPCSAPVKTIDLSHRNSRRKQRKPARGGRCYRTYHWYRRGVRVHLARRLSDATLKPFPVGSSDRRCLARAEAGHPHAHQPVTKWSKKLNDGRHKSRHRSAINFAFPATRFRLRPLHMEATRRVLRIVSCTGCPAGDRGLQRLAVGNAYPPRSPTERRSALAQGARKNRDRASNGFWSISSGVLATDAP